MLAGFVENKMYVYLYFQTKKFIFIIQPDTRISGQPGGSFCQRSSVIITALQGEQLNMAMTMFIGSGCTC